MYTFTDTVDSQETSALPPEAVCINGKWLDREIPEFTTLAVYGREIMPQSVDAIEGTTDGALFVSRRYSTRSLIVRAQVKAETPERYRAAFNALNAALVGDLRIICADEPDKYFSGILSSTAMPEPGRLCSVFEFEIFCGDPFKRALEKKTFEAYQDPTAEYYYLIDVKNTGAFPAPVSLKISHKKRNGFIAVICGDKRLHIGDLDEPITNKTSGPQELLSLQDFIDAAAYTGTDALHPWHTTNGRLGIVDIRPDGATNTKPWLALTTKGSASDGGGYGGVKEVAVPADAAGESGAKDWKCLFFSWFQHNRPSEMGSQSLAFIAADGTIIASVNIYRAANGQAIAEFAIGQNQKTFTFSSDTNSWLALGTRGNQHMEKTGGTLKFWYGSQYFTLVDDDMAEKICTKIQLKIGGYQGKPEMTRNYIGSLRFEKKDVQAETDYPNRYPAGTVIDIDGAAGKIYIDGTYRPDQETTQNEWPIIPAGQTKTLAIATSGFYPATKDTAEIAATIEEVWL